MGKIFINSVDLIIALYRNKKTEITMYSYNNEPIYIKGGCTIEFGEEIEFIMNSTVDTEETDPFKCNKLSIYYMNNGLMVSSKDRYYTVRSCELIILNNLKYQKSNDINIIKGIEEKKDFEINEYNKIQMNLYEEYKKRQYKILPQLVDNLISNHLFKTQ